MEKCELFIICWHISPSFLIFLKQGAKLVHMQHNLQGSHSAHTLWADDTAVLGVTRCCNSKTMECSSLGRAGHQTLTSLAHLSESVAGCQTRRDHIIITVLTSSGLLNCGNLLVKSDVSMALLSSFREMELWESEDEPQGTGTCDGKGNRHCQ